MFGQKVDFAHARPVRHGLLVEAVDEPLRGDRHLLSVHRVRHHHRDVGIRVVSEVFAGVHEGMIDALQQTDGSAPDACIDDERFVQPAFQVILAHLQTEAIPLAIDEAMLASDEVLVGVQNVDARDGDQPATPTADDKRGTGVEATNRKGDNLKEVPPSTRWSSNSMAQSMSGSFQSLHGVNFTPVIGWPGPGVISLAAMAMLPSPSMPALCQC